MLLEHNAEPVKWPNSSPHGSQNQRTQSPCPAFSLPIATNSQEE